MKHQTTATTNNSNSRSLLYRNDLIKATVRHTRERERENLINEQTQKIHKNKFIVTFLPFCFSFCSVCRFFCLDAQHIFCSVFKFRIFSFVKWKMHFISVSFSVPPLIIALNQRFFFIVSILKIEFHQRLRLFAYSFPYFRHFNVLIIVLIVLLVANHNENGKSLFWICHSIAFANWQLKRNGQHCGIDCVSFNGRNEAKKSNA